MYVACTLVVLGIEVRIAEEVSESATSANKRTQQKPNSTLAVIRIFFLEPAGDKKDD